VSVLPVGFGSSGGLQITNSVRLRAAAANAYFNKAFAGAGSTTWALSLWLKRGDLGAGRSIFSTSTGSEDFYFNPSDQLVMWKGGTVAISTALFRDPSAHGHLVIRGNGTNVKAYWNNVEVASYTGTMAAINTAIAHRIGYDGAYYFDGLLSDVYFVDGQVLTPSSFGETNSDGVWVPKSYTGTYGTNGFHLDFKDAAVTAGSNAGLGKDVSVNGNYWTTSAGISVTAGVTYDSMVDTPTNNYATLNPLDQLKSHTPTYANLRVSSTTTSHQYCKATVPVPYGMKAYFEATNGTLTTASLLLGLGVATSSAAGDYGNANTWGIKWADQKTLFAQTVGGAAFGSTLAANAIVQMAVDGTTGYVWIGDGTNWYNSTGGTTGDPAAGTNPTFTTSVTTGDLFAWIDAYGNSNTVDLNFGQRPFTYTPPTGFKALCTANLPNGTVTTSGSFTGTLAADGPFVWINGCPTAMTINGNAVTFGTHADKTAGGFKLRTASASYNNTGSNTYSVSTNAGRFNIPQTAQGNP
jgi:hypothetical protein